MKYIKIQRHIEIILVISVVKSETYLVQVKELRNERQFQFSTIFSLKAVMDFC